MRSRHGVWLIWTLLAAACSGEAPDYDALWRVTTTRVRTQTVKTQGPDGRTAVHQRPHLTDAFGRYVHLRGINVSGSHKAPPTEDFPSLYPLPEDADLRAGCKKQFPLSPACIPSREVSYVGRPFPLDEADRWYGQLAALGFNSVRLITNWESIQPYRPGTCAGRDGYSEDCYDLQYLAYYDALIAKAREHGIYVLVDMHQDLFSRYLMSYYSETPSYRGPNGDPAYPEPGTFDSLLLSLFPPFTDWARGHGAPRWVVETCLPEKNLDSEYWGFFRALGQLRTPEGAVNLPALLSIQKVFARLFPEGQLPPYLQELLTERVPARHFEVNETSDFLPLTPWFFAGLLSMDVNRCYAALFAGDTVFPTLVVDADGRTRRRDEVPAGEPTTDLKTHLQDAYTAAWLQLVKRAKKHDNVIGYDLMNEPMGLHLMLAIGGIFAQSNPPSDAADPDAPPETGPVNDLLVSLLGDDFGAEVFELIEGLALLPPDARPETLRKWGWADIDPGAALDLLMGFDAGYLQPLYEKVGQAIQAEDPNAIIWFEPGVSIRSLTGASPFWDRPMTRPKGIDQVVYTPHFYPDIYPTAGINSDPRRFGDDEWLYRDFTERLQEDVDNSPAWLGNVPVVYGEFGTYFNFGGIEKARESGYLISAHLLNRYYEAFETLGLGNMVWCFSAENDYQYGEHWNHEDFSVIDPAGEPRAWPAYVRTHARATSGRLVRQQFNSQYHFWDPQGGVPPPERTYTLEMEMRETDAPTEVFVPQRQYPDGFYVWLSDGRAYYDAARQVLYWYPTAQTPGVRHALRVEPTLPDREALGWAYFFRGDRAVDGEVGP